MRTKEQLAWAAGFFDGEGHFGCRDRTGGSHLPKYKSPRTIVASISQHHTEVLETFQEAVGFGKIYSVSRKRPSGVSYVSYSWRVGKFELVQATLSLMWPWLGTVKKSQGHDALQLWHSLDPSK